MRSAIRWWRNLAVLALLVCLPFAQAGAKDAKNTETADAAMHLHHMHTMMNHALSMALQGADLVMISQMKMAPGVDDVTLSHGKAMLADARTMMKDTLSGPMMIEMHKKGNGKSPEMGYTHQLGGAILSVIDDLENMKTGEVAADDMTMHHMHLALNHALEMAAEGADLVMMGQMSMAKGVDQHTTEHGKKMLASAQQLWQEVMSGKAMTAMHAAGSAAGSSEMMGETHKLANDEKKVLDLLVKMPAVAPAKQSAQ